MICTAILIVNMTGAAWLPEDFKHINRAQEVCQDRYKSCLSKITKQKMYTFQAICGNEKKSLILKK